MEGQQKATRDKKGKQEKVPSDDCFAESASRAHVEVHTCHTPAGNEYISMKCGQGDIMAWNNVHPYNKSQASLA